MCPSRIWDSEHTVIESIDFPLTQSKNLNKSKHGYRDTEEDNNTFKTHNLEFIEGQEILGSSSLN